MGNEMLVNGLFGRMYRVLSITVWRCFEFLHISKDVCKIFTQQISFSQKCCVKEWERTQSVDAQSATYLFINVINICENTVILCVLHRIDVVAYRCTGRSVCIRMHVCVCARACQDVGVTCGTCSQSILVHLDHVGLFNHCTAGVTFKFWGVQSKQVVITVLPFFT